MEYTVSTALRLNASQFVAGLGVAGAQLKSFGRDLAGTMSQAQAKTSEAFKGIAGASDQHLKTIGTAGLIMGGAIVAGFGVAAVAAMSFDKQMSEVGAVAGATGEELGQLRQAALDAGQATVFSAGQAAQAQAELAKAGVSTADILGGGLTGALDLAAAGSLDLGNAASIAANAMTIFSLKGSDVGHIADLLAAGANKSATDVAEMGLALKQGGAQAANMGISLEQTVGLLAVFAQNALKGSDGGTAMKTMLQSLAGSSGPARKAIEELGLQFFDAKGKFLGLENAAEELKNKLGPLSDQQRSLALNTIFGTDASRGAIAMMKGGGDAVREWTDEVNQSGYAAQLAAEKNNNLAGDLEQLKGSIETALIEGGSKATTVLRGLAAGATDLVSGFSAMPDPLQGAFIGLTGIAGLASAGIGIYGTLAPKIREVKEALEGMGGIGPSIARNLGGIGLAAGGLGIVMLGLTAIYADAAKRQSEVDAGAKEYETAIRAQTGALEENVNAVTAKKFAEGSLGKLLKDTGADYRVLAAGIRENETQLDAWRGLINSGSTGIEILGKKLVEAAEGGDVFATELVRLKGEMSTADFLELIRQLEIISTSYQDGKISSEVYDQALAGLGIQADGTAAKTGELGEQTDSTSDSFAQAKKDIDAAVKALQDWYDQTTAGLSAEIAFRDSLVDVTDSVKDHGSSLDLATDAGRRNADSLIAAKDKIVDWGVEVFNATQSTDAASFAMNNMVGALTATMKQAGYTEQQIADYLFTLGLTPEQIATQVLAIGTAQAKTDVGGVNTELDRTNQGANGTVDVDTRPALDKLSALHRRMIDIYNTTGTAGAPMSERIGSANGNIFAANANGNIYGTKMFAGGGIEHHQPMIAKGGLTRIWNEPETGGESYIPHAMGKRPRATRILGQTAGMFGYDLTPSGSSAANQAVTTNHYDGDTITIVAPPSDVSPYAIERRLSFKRRYKGR